MFLRISSALLFFSAIMVLHAGDTKSLPGVDVVGTLRGHSELVYSVAFSKDGKQLATGSFDNTVKLWETATNKETTTFGGPQGHQKMVLSVAISPDGQSLASGGADNTAKVWDIPNSTPLRNIANNDGILNITLSPDGTKLAGACNDGAIKIWNPADSKLLFTLTGHAGPTTGVAFSANNLFLVSGGKDGTVRFWNVTNGTLMQTINAHKGAVTGVAFHPGNNAVYSIGSDGFLKFWKVPPPNARAVTATAAIAASFVSSAFDRRAMFLSAPGRGILADMTPLARQIAAGQGPLESLIVTPPGSHILTGGADKMVKVWNTANGNNERSIATAGNVKALAITKNNVLLAIATGDQAVTLFQAGDGKQLGSAKAAAVVRSLSFSPNNLTLCAATVGKTFTALNVTFNPGQPLPAEFLRPIQTFADAVTDVTFAADNATIFTSSLDKNLRMWRLASPTPTKNFPHPNVVDIVAFHPTQPMLATGGHDGKVRLFDLVKGNQIREINAHQTKEATMIYALVFSPDGKQIVSGSYDGSLKLWDVNNGNLVKDFKAFKVKEAEKGHQDPVFSAAFSPDGKFLASGSGGLERVIKIWNVADGSVARDLSNPGLKVLAPPPPVEKIGPGGTAQTAVAGAAGSIPIAKTEPRPIAQSHPGWVYQLRFTSDGKHLISAGDAPLNKGYLAVWSPTDGRMVYGESLPLGTFFGLAITPDNKLVALGAGPRGRPTPEFNSAYLMKIQALGK